MKQAAPRRTEGHTADPEQAPNDHSAIFSFPTLSPDGSVEDVRAHTISPAARNPTSLKATMAEHDPMMDSTLSFADSQYDMVDDASDVSNEDHDTASLASTEHTASEDGAETAEDQGSVAGEEHVTIEHQDADLTAEPMQPRDGADVPVKTVGSTGSSPQLMAQGSGEKLGFADSYLSEDLETPRQSTLPGFNHRQTQRQPPVTPTSSYLKLVSRATSNVSTARSPTEMAGSKSEGRIKKSTAASKVKQRARVGSGVLANVVTVLIYLAISSAIAYNFWPRTSPVAETAVRREALTTALMKLTNSTDVNKTFNIQHLVPQPDTTSTNIFGQPVYGMPYASYSQGALPNHIIASLTKKPGNLRYPSPVSARVFKANRNIAFNQTQLIDGIYDITIDPKDAHGFVDLRMITKNPTMNIHMRYNFGNRMLQRQTYEKAGTELSKSVNSELTEARRAARSLGEKVHLELSAGAAATKNVTTQLAVSMARDLQVFTHTAASMFGKIGHAGNHTVATLRKDLMIVHQDLVRFGHSLSKSLSATGQSAKALVPSKKAVISPLQLSRTRALGFKQKLLGAEKEANSSSSSATKELSLYFQHFFKPGTHANKPSSSLRDIASCLPARDYKACQLAREKSLALKAPSALATVPGNKAAVETKSAGRSSRLREESRHYSNRQAKEAEAKTTRQQGRSSKQAKVVKKTGK